MTTKEFFNLFLITSALHGFLFNLVILFSKTRKAKNLVFINLLILVISINNLQFWILAKGFFENIFFINYAQLPWQFLIAPFFYLFLIHYLEIKKKITLKLTLSVFIILILVRIIFINYYSDKTSINITFLLKKYTAIEEIFNLASSLIIFIYTYYILSKKEKLSTKIVDYDNLKWLYNFFKLGGLIYFFGIIALTITLISSFKEIIYFYYPLRILTTILIYWLGYQAVIQISRLSEKKYLRKKLNNFEPIASRKDKLTIKDFEINIPKETVKNILEKLHNFEIKKQYTSNSITLNTLAKKLNTNSNYLSKVINYYKKKSFTSYLNDLRINNIIHQLNENTAISKFTIKAIAEEAGFSNSSAFSKTFIKTTGEKPSQYIKKLNKQRFIIQN